MQELTMVGDRGMITSARVADLKKNTNFSWVTALRNTDIQALAEDEGPLQMSLFDEQNLAEISHPQYPGERLIACRNPALAERRAHVFLCMLAADLTWHLRTAWAPLTYTDENRPTPQEPIAKVTRSNAAARKASTHKLDDGSTASSYQDLLAHLATRARNTTKLTKPITSGTPTIRGS